MGEIFVEILFDFDPSANNLFRKGGVWERHPPNLERAGGQRPLYFNSIKMIVVKSMPG